MFLPVFRRIELPKALIALFHLLNRELNHQSEVVEFAENYGKYD